MDPIPVAPNGLEEALCDESWRVRQQRRYADYFLAFEPATNKPARIYIATLNGEDALIWPNQIFQDWAQRLRIDPENREKNRLLLKKAQFFGGETDIDRQGRFVPSAKTQEEASNEKAKELGQSSPDSWMVRLTGIIAVIGLIQTIVFGMQAHRLKQTIEKMDEIAGQQTRDVQASVGEAPRAATAMEQVANSMGINVLSVKESVTITREIADRQKLITELQSRAYLTTIFDGMVPQNHFTGVRFEPRIQIVNRGNTPARNIRFSIDADVLPFPLREEFVFPLPTKAAGYSSVIGPGLHKIISAVVPKLYQETEATQISSGIGQRITVWGLVKYQDAFDMERFVEFAFTHFSVGDNQWMSQDTSRHNDSN